MNKIDFNSLTPSEIVEVYDSLASKKIARAWAGEKEDDLFDVPRMNRQDLRRVSNLATICSIGNIYDWWLLNSFKSGQCKTKQQAMAKADEELRKLGYELVD